MEEVRKKIEGAFFTGKGDQPVVVGLYRALMTAIGNAMVRSEEGVAAEYEGEKNAAGEAEGYGKERLANGDEYEGEYRAGKKDGYGKVRFADGDEYEGEWKAGRMEGRGTYRIANGDVYEGEYKADKKEGRGTFRFANGNVHEGEYKVDKIDGRGTFRYANGDVEVGSYKAGEDVGEGDRWTADGQTACLLQDGQPVEEISLEAAAAVAAKVGEPGPTVGVVSA